MMHWKHMKGVVVSPPAGAVTPIRDPRSLPDYHLRRLAEWLSAAAIVRMYTDW